MLGWKQDEIADMFGLDRSTISKNVKNLSNFVYPKAVL